MNLLHDWIAVNDLGTVLHLARLKKMSFKEFVNFIAASGSDSLSYFWNVLQSWFCWRIIYVKAALEIEKLIV